MFESDLAQCMLEDYFIDNQHATDEELVSGMNMILMSCGASEETDSDEMIECISTAAHNANVQEWVGGVLGYSS